MAAQHRRRKKQKQGQPTRLKDANARCWNTSSSGELWRAPDGVGVPHLQAALAAAAAIAVVASIEKISISSLYGEKCVPDQKIWPDGIEVEFIK